MIDSAPFRRVLFSHHADRVALEIGVWGREKGARDPTQRHFLAEIRGDNPGVLGSGDQVIGYPEFFRTKVTDVSPVPEGIN